MGKGDIKSKRGKINKSSYGKSRPKPKNKAAYKKPAADATDKADA